MLTVSAVNPISKLQTQGNKKKKKKIRRTYKYISHPQIRMTFIGFIFFPLIKSS